MSQKTRIVRNSLISLALAASLPAAWADSAPTEVVPVHGAVTAPLHRPLDLTPPDIRTVMPEEDLDTPLEDPDDVSLAGPETVQVHGASPAPYVPGGFAALWWGVLHPTQAWRILTPVQ